MKTMPEGTLLRVLFVDPELSKPPEEHPFACVVSEAPGEKLYKTTKPCLYVFCAQDGVFEFADGLYAVESQSVGVGDPIEWPVLSTALFKTPKLYSKSLMPKQGDLGFERVMLWHKYKHTNPPQERNAEGHALRAFKAAKMWNVWLEKAVEANRHSSTQKWGFDDAVKDMSSDEEWAKLKKSELQCAAGENLRKFCEDIGLRRPHATDFDTPYGQLLEVLRDTLKLNQGVRAKMMAEQQRN